ncbi:Quinolone resistance protein norA, putative [Perkinsus marinus ATCC 50983]|uniref:Quinolone resistance protein norA, putative n=1 Tax=Perkinsus marinus (strain ATCC 50983 / TXsc) TaxID=423536 RepID=C5KX86_PERM5|nr:Quinolone resistance protein norA, putative [Perkinsus marinus ATCC 50983]EER10942.1 Quinolone resistance protein norA, putative [Perkinsus marinus ATCC 50983]|eukprot:XP_002779147.1 Quinolone resistance protein norA, putative [Perkinsus marinus ATCC 50983]
MVELWSFLLIPDRPRKGPLTDEDYYNLKAPSRLAYRLKYHPRRILDLVLIFASLFLEWLANTMLAPVTPWYVERLAPEMNPGTAASILMASYAVGTFCSSMVTGPISDRIGRRPVIVGAMTIFMVSQFLVANAWDLGSFAGFRAMGGVAAGTRPVIMAFILDSSRYEDMKMYGVMFGLCVVVGQAVGPSIGGALAEITLSFPFYFVGVLGAILVLLLLLFLTESLHKDENGMPIRRTGGPEVVMAKNKFLWPTVACMALAAFAGQYIEINWSTVFGLLGSEQYHLNPCQNGGVLSIGVLAMIAVNIVYVPVTRVIEPALVGSIGLFVSCLIVIVPFIHNLVGVIFLGMAIQGGAMCYFAGMGYFSASVCPPKTRGLVNSVIMASANSGGIFGPFAAGTLYGLNTASPFYLSVGVSCLGGLACFGIQMGIAYQSKLNDDAVEGLMTDVHDDQSTTRTVSV